MIFRARLQEYRIEPPETFADEDVGAVADFSGVVRREEKGECIRALVYEAYAGMAEREMRRLAEEIALCHPVGKVEVIHRIGTIPVGEIAIWMRVQATHRAEAFAFLAEFMNRLKAEVPIWKLGVVKESCMGQSTAPGGRVSSASGSRDWQVEEVWKWMDETLRALPVKTLPIEQCGGLICAQSVRAVADYPPFAQSAMDGYAVCGSEPEAGFLITDEILVAGVAPAGQLLPGQAVRIMTGAPVPEGADAVLRQEDVVVENGRLRLKTDLTWPGRRHIRSRAGVARAGEEIVPAGAMILPGAMGFLISAGVREIEVVPRPRVRHLTTGSELAVEGETAKPGKIYDSNGPMMAALLQQQGFTMERRCLCDDFDQLVENIRDYTGDVLLISGGSGPGERDYTGRALEASGYVLQVARVNSRPGRPLIVAVRGAQVAFGLPGNPLSHFVCYGVFVTRALARLCGRPVPELWKARLIGQVQPTAPDPRPTWTPGLMRRTPEGWEVEALSWNHSGDTRSLCAANCLIWGKTAVGGQVKVLTWDLR